LVMDDVLVGEGQQKEVNKIGENMGIATNWSFNNSLSFW
jgi:hypothetical protein